MLSCTTTQSIRANDRISDCRYTMEKGLHGRARIQQRHILLVVYYASIYEEIVMLSETTSSDVILPPRSIFARHGVPQSVVSDSGRQYAQQVFANGEGFVHCISSPCYIQSYGKAERTMHTVKAMLSKFFDPYGAVAGDIPNGIP